MNNNIIGNINSEYKNDKLVMKSTNSIFYSSFYFQDLYDDALVKKFIKMTESIIRTSREYNLYISMLKTNYNILNYDNIQSHISSSDASIEFHHYPLTLYDIVDTVMTYHINNSDNFTSFSLAKEIMDLHFNHKIGIVPLTKTNHELAHGNNLFLSEKQIFGQWKDFVEIYKSGISPELDNKIKNIIKLSESKINSDSRF